MRSKAKYTSKALQSIGFTPTLVLRFQLLVVVSQLFYYSFLFILSVSFILYTYSILNISNYMQLKIIKNNINKLYIKMNLLWMDNDIWWRTNNYKMHKETNQNKARTKMDKHIRIMLPQWEATHNISTYINEKPHTSFENTLIKQIPHL